MTKTQEMGARAQQTVLDTTSAAAAHLRTAADTIENSGQKGAEFVGKASDEVSSRIDKAAAMINRQEPKQWADCAATWFRSNGRYVLAGVVAGFLIGRIGRT